jgi:hypothetical protein
VKTAINERKRGENNTKSHKRPQRVGISRFGQKKRIRAAQFKTFNDLKNNTYTNLFLYSMTMSYPLARNAQSITRSWRLHLAWHSDVSDVARDDSITILFGGSDYFNH